jgi:hypothetical protein
MITYSTTDSYIIEKVSPIRSFTDILYSDRKHEKYPGRTDKVKHFILMDCTNVRSRIKSEVK